MDKIKKMNKQKTMFTILTVRELTKVLNKLPEDYKVYLASDEEHNSVMEKFYISKDDDEKAIIIAGLSGTELEQYN